MSHRKMFGCTPRAIAFALALSALCGAARAPGPARAQEIDPEFPITDSGVLTSALSGNTLYVGGYFNLIGRRTGHAAVLDKATAEPFGLLADGPVLVAVPDGSGGWYIGGNFTSIRGIPRSRIAHIASDLAVSDWNPGADNIVSALAVSGSTLYVGGSFQQIGGAARSSIAALDGASGLATAWNPGANGPVEVLALDGPTVYAGGHFTSIGGAMRHRIAALNAAGVATAWDPGASGPVFALAVGSGVVYAGGEFDSIGGVPKNHAAALDPSTGSPTAWNPDPNSTVRALVSTESVVYVAGGFSIIGGRQQSGIAEVDAVSGVPTDWDPQSNGGINALSLNGSAIVVGGDFTSIGGQERFRLATIDRANGDATGWTAHANEAVLAVAVSGSKVLAGGLFRSAAMKTRRALAAIDIASKEVTDWNPSPDNNVFVIALGGTTLYVGGSFSMIGGQPRNKLAALDAATGSSTAWDPLAGTNTDFAIFSGLAVDNCCVYVAGSFCLSIGGQDRCYASAFDRSTGSLTGWNPAPNNVVTSLVVDGSRIYAGGWFAAIGGQARQRLAALDKTTGAAIEGWQADVDDSEVNALTLSGSTLYFGGYFSHVAGEERHSLAAVDATTGTLSSWNPMYAGYPVHWSLAADNSYVYAGTNGLSVVDRVTGTLHPSYDFGEPSGNVETVTLGGMSLYVGGGFRDHLAAIVTTPADAPQGPPAAKTALLLRNLPNPAYRATAIRFALSRPEKVTLQVFDLAGREVRVLVAGERLEAGNHERHLDTTALPPGVYLYRLRAGAQQQTQRLLVIH